MSLPSRLVPAALVLSVLAVSPAGAAPPSLQEAWSAPAGVLDQGNFDDDPNTELLVFDTNIGEFVFLDAGTGSGEGSLNPGFANINNFQSWVADVDSDGRDEILVSYQPPASPRMTALYDWTPGGGYDEVYLHNDDYNSLLWGALRSSDLDVIENRLNDLAIRDFFGNVIFLASSDIPGWGGAGLIETLQVLDVDADGLDEILVGQTNAGLKTLRLVDFPAVQTAVGETPGTASARLLSYPNPAAGASTIAYELPQDGRAVVRIYDAQGRLVRDLVDTTLRAGKHADTWDGRNNQGLSVASGTYFYRLDAPGVRATQRMIRLR